MDQLATLHSLVQPHLGGFRVRVEGFPVNLPGAVEEDEHGDAAEGEGDAAA
jgi:hypothetical protein